MLFCHIDPLNFSLWKQKTAQGLNLANSELETHQASNGQPSPTRLASVYRPHALEAAAARA